MATTQNDNRAKFLELRKQGISVADARNQTYGPPPVVPDATPTTPTPPTPAPAPTVNVQEQMAGKNVAERQAIRNGIPTTPTPVTPTPTPTVATTPPVSQAPVQDPTPGITQSSFQQAQAESEKIKAQNEAQMKLNTQQADLKAQERQQVAQETARANTPTNQKDVLNALVSGVSVAPQNTSAYRNAQMQYKTYQKFATMTPTQIVDNMKMGEIGTETAQLLASNPNYIKAKEDFDKFQKNQSINNMIKSVAEGATGKTTEVDHYQNASDAIAKKLGITETNADAFARIVSKDPETLQLTKTVSNIAKQLNTLNTERNAVYEDLKKQYPDLSASAIMTLMAGRTKEATAQIDALNSSLTLTQADLKMAMEMAKSEYDATKEDITLQAGLAKEDRAYQQALDLSQAQFEQGLTQKAQLTNDPVSAITTMVEEYKKLGVPFTRSTQQVISDFQSSGQDLPTYLSELQKLIQSKPEYQAYKEKQSGTEWQSTNITRYNPSTGANESTPIFYRKKTSGGFEAVDLSGNPIDSSVLASGGVTGGISATGDMSGLASNYPYEASFKNNNTSGITWGMSEKTKKLLTDAGIKISEGTARPSREGGKYVKFDNISDGLLAHKILLSQAGSDDINARLQQWVGTKEGPTYAKNLMDQAGIAQGTKFSQLTPEQLDKLVMVQVKKESPGMYNELTKGITGTTTTPAQTYDPDKIKSFEAFNGTTFPADYKTPAQQKQYRDEYNSWIASKPGKKIESGNDLINIKLDKPTGEQSASMAYGARMIDAAKNAQKYEDIFTKLPIAEQVYQTNAPDLITSQNQKSLMREKMDFITAVLRKESGAAISPSEFSGQDKIFFPQPGDGPEVLLAKRNARNFRVKAMLATAGQDIEGNSLSKYYNPPVIIQDQIAPQKTDKISTLKKNYFQ